MIVEWRSLGSLLILSEKTSGKAKLMVSDIKQLSFIREGHIVSSSTNREQFVASIIRTHKFANLFYILLGLLCLYNFMSPLNLCGVQSQ